MLVLVTAILAVQTAAAGAPIGVAASSRDGQLCVAMPSPALAPGTTITLIQPAHQQSVLVATIARSVPSCERLERAMIPGPYYLARGATPTVADSGTVWVALSGRLGTRRVGSGAIVVQLGTPYANAQVRSCTSREGVHLTVWAGTPLKSQRLWHAYYYLGYDVEPSCEDGDVRQPKQLLQPTSGAEPMVTFVRRECRSRLSDRTVDCAGGRESSWLRDAYPKRGNNDAVRESAAHPEQLAIGIDEATALIVRGEHAKVVGLGTVTCTMGQAAAGP